MKPTSFSSIIIFTDGACTGNPGPGGWGAITTFPDGTVNEQGGGNPETTNNRMEMVAPIRALAALDPETATDIVLYTDSTYVIRGITQWVWGWRKRGWKNAEGNEVSNKDLWEELSRQVSRLKPVEIQWKYVRGHTGVPGNERCDQIAVAFSQGKKVKLYSGSILRYDVAIHDLPEDQELPPMKTYDKSEKPKAHSYISSLGGIVYRHQDWASCERRIKGQSGAKFKKAMSEADEKTILKSWGLDPDKTDIRE